MAIIQNITIDQDCDYTETLTVKDSTGTTSFGVPNAVQYDLIL